VKHRLQQFVIPLRSIRERAGLPREHLAVRAHTTSRTLYRLESSPSAYLGTSLGMLRGIADALDVTVLDLCPWLASSAPFPPSSPSSPLDTDPAEVILE